MELFRQDTAIEALGDNRWRAQLSPDWCVGPVPNGGYVLAIAARALAAALPHKEPLSINAFYLAPTGVGPAELVVEPLRCGGSTSFAMVRLYQQGELKVQATAALTDFARLRGETRVLVEPQPIPPFADCVALRPAPHVSMARQIWQKVLPGQEKSLLGEPQQNGRWDGWIDFRDDTPVDLFALLYFSDAYPPPLFSLYGPTGWVPTVELTVQLRGRPAPGPVRCQFTSQMLTDGVVEEDGLLWDSAGKLVAISRQTAKFRL